MRFNKNYKGKQITALGFVGNIDEKKADTFSHCLEHRPPIILLVILSVVFLCQKKINCLSLTGETKCISWVYIKAKKIFR